MFFSLNDRSHTFTKPESSKLIMAIPLSARAAIFICDNHTFYHYSMLENKILYQSKLPGYPIQGIAISAHQILCIIKDRKALILFDIRERKIQHVSNLPLTKMFNENRERDLLTQTKLISFEKSHSLCVYEPRVEQSKSNVFIFSHIKQQNQQIKRIAEKQFDIRRKVIKKLDSYSKLVIYNQQIEDNGVFNFSTVDTDKQFTQKVYQLHNQSFTKFAIVNQIISISNKQQQQRLLIFVNCQSPSILLVQHDEVSEYCYQSKKIFLKTVLVDVDLQYGIFKFMPDPEVIDPQYDNEFELVELRGGKVQQTKKRTMHQFVSSCDDDYQLQYRRQISQSTIVNFQTYHIINKQTTYMKMLWETGFEDLPEDLMKKIIEQAG